jgi:hypothetical protein
LGKTIGELFDGWGIPKALKDAIRAWELAAEKVGRAADRVATYYDDKKLREESK